MEPGTLELWNLEHWNPGTLEPGTNEYFPDLCLHHDRVRQNHQH